MNEIKIFFQNYAPEILDPADPAYLEMMGCKFGLKWQMRELYLYKKMKTIDEQEYGSSERWDKGDM